MEKLNVGQKAISSFLQNSKDVSQLSKNLLFPSSSFTHCPYFVKMGQLSVAQSGS
jgi:hypothetical protein